MDFSNKHRLLTFVAIFASILIVMLLKWTAPAKTPEMKALPKARVELYHVQTRDISVSEVLRGRLVPLRRTELKFEVSGQVISRQVEPGQRHEQGQVLLQLDERDYNDIAMDAKAQLQEERVAIKRDRQLLKLAMENQSLQEKEVRRQQRLLKKSLTSQSSLDAARQQLFTLKREVSSLQYNVDSAAARLQLRQSASERAQRNLERCQLKSPWEGVVNQVYVQQGDYVSPSQVAVDMIDDSRLEFMLNLRGEIAHHLQTGATVEVKVDGRQVDGKIVAVQMDPDPATFTHEVRVRLPAGVGYAGQMVQARISLPALEQVVVVPVTALHYESGQQFVMLYQQGSIKRKVIEPGARVGNEQVVLSGLAQGDTIVSRDVASLSEGQKVEVTKTVE